VRVWEKVAGLLGFWFGLEHKNEGKERQSIDLSIPL
jgi:hypothetical protein